MQKIIIFALVLSLIFVLCACNMQNEDNGGNSADKSDISSESNVSVPEKLPDGAIKITTDKEHYSFDDTLTFKITVDSDGEFTYGRESRVQYLDENGDWKTSEKGFYFTEDAFVATFESEYSFPVSERAVPGKEKYRIILRIHHLPYSYTVYSNEFTIE